MKEKSIIPAFLIFARIFLNETFHVLQAPKPKAGKICVLFWFFWYLLRFWQKVFGAFLVPPQVLAIESCQNLRMYKKTKTLLLKPEEVQKKKIFMSWRPPGPKIGKSLLFLFFFWYLFRFWQKKFGLFGTSSGVGNKIVPKPEEVPTKTKPFY